MTERLPDEELMLHVRNGNADMLAPLFERYEAPLFNFFCKLSGDRAASEDLVQDVFFRVLKYRHTYAPGNAFRTWLYKIARNARHDQYRKRRNEVGWLDEVAIPPEVPDEIEKSQQLALLQRALMRLPEEKRELLVLCRFQEMKYADIAELLGIEAGTVKTRIFRALRELKDIYQQLSRPDGRAGAAGNNPERGRTGGADSMRGRGAPPAFFNHGVEA